MLDEMVFTYRLNILLASSNAQIQMVTISVQFSFFLGTIYVDQLSLKQFDWKRRFYIVQIICRGPLYLRRDSRRRIIHGDLKPCNILLHDQMNPKISDIRWPRSLAAEKIKRMLWSRHFFPVFYCIELSMVWAKN
jgi:hypothetical protein